MVKLKQLYILFFTLVAGIFLMQGNTVNAADNAAILLELAQEGRIYEVKPDGTGDFRSIQEGVNTVESGDTLLIYPGIYEECVVIVDKTVNLIGADARNCILTANSDNYHYIPLTIGAGRVSGLTIRGTSRGNFSNVLAGVPGTMSYDIMNPDSIYQWQNNYSGYAVHVDQSYSSGKTLRIEECKIISENNYCIGIGCWDSTKIAIEGCELVSSGDSGCIFIHNTNYQQQVGTAQVTIRDSALQNYVGPYVMAVHSEGECNPVDLTFQNVKVSTVAYENNDCYSRNNVNTWFYIDQLENDAIWAYLRENGYTSLQKGSQLVHERTVEEHIQFNQELEDQSSNSLPLLAEGITYWESATPVQTYSGKKRYCIDVKNTATGTAGDGWCGLSGIYLTEDSYGNTLPEMNYPRSEMTASMAE